MSEMGRCRDCRWWGSEDFDGMRICEMTTVVDWKPLHAASKALTSPESAGADSLFTYPDFGCIQFEAKE